MPLYDKNFKTHKVQYILQCTAVGVLIIGVLFGLGSVVKMDILGAIGASSLASTVSLVFMAPKSVMSKARNILGAYFLGILIGMLCYYSDQLLRSLHPDFSTSYNAIFFGGIAVSLTQFFMVLFDVEHSPGAGIAIGLVVEKWQFLSLIIIVIFVILLTIIRYSLRNRLLSLV